MNRANGVPWIAVFLPMALLAGQSRPPYGLGTFLSTPAQADETSDLSDSEILDALLAALDAEGSVYHLTQSRTQDPAVRELAHQALADQRSILGDIQKLRKENGIEPKVGALGQNYRKGKSRTLRILNSLQGKKFDQSYVKHEVAYQHDFLRTLETQLLPGARDLMLRNILMKADQLAKKNLRRSEQGGDDTLTAQG